MLTSSWIILTTASVALLVLSEAFRFRPGVWIFKPLSSAGFLGIAWSQQASDSRFGTFVFAALILCWIGDFLLIPHDKRAFKAGIGSFLLGHVLFAVSFLVFGIEPLHALIGAVGVAPLSWLVARWLMPKVPPELKIPVIAYAVVISGMVALAAGTIATDPSHLLFPAAVAFFLSDLSVARDRFVQKSFLNRAWGLPLYYLAQIVLAWSAGIKLS